MVSLRSLAGVALAFLVVACSEREADDAPLAEVETPSQEAAPVPEEIEPEPTPEPEPQDDDVPGTEEIPDDPDEASTVEPDMNEETARCVIGPGRYDGPCTFVPQADGTFILARANDVPLYGDTAAVTVATLGADVAEVRSRTMSGMEMRWGRAERSEQDPACWLGPDFSVCAY